jgi:hypothetical protein
MVPAEGSARATAPIGVDVEAVMKPLRANDRVGFCRSARVRKWPILSVRRSAAVRQLSEENLTFGWHGPRPPPLVGGRKIGELTGHSVAPSRVAPPQPRLSRGLPEHVDLFGRLSEFATKFTAP